MSLVGQHVPFGKQVNASRLLAQLWKQLQVAGTTGPEGLNVLESPEGVTLEQVQAVLQAHQGDVPEIPSLQRQLVELWKLAKPPAGSEPAQMKQRVLDAFEAGEL